MGSLAEDGGGGAPRQPFWRRHPRAALGLLIAALVALHAPSLGLGLLADDHVHQVVLDGSASGASLRPWNLYAFGSSAEDSGAFDIGGLLWFTSPDWELRFLRPVTSLSLWLDHALFGARPALSHAMSLALFAGVLALAWRLMHALRLSRGTALLALALFGVAESSVVPVAWLANRNSLLVVLLQLAALLALGPLDASGLTRAERRARLAAALACALLCSLSKESGVVTFALISVRLAVGQAVRIAPAGELQGQERALDRTEPARRLHPAVLALPLLLGLAYVAAWSAAGYGGNSRFYPAPWEHPGLVAARAPFLLLGGALASASPLSLDLGFAFPRAMLPLNLLGAALIALLWRPLAAALHGRRALGLLLLAWALLPLAPQLAAPPSDRLLFESALPLAIALALAIAELRRAHRPAANWLIVSALALPAPSNLARQLGLNLLGAQARTQVATAAAAADTADARELILLQTPSPLAALATGAQARLDLGRSDLRLWPIQMGGRPLRLTRVSEHSFELESLGLPFLAAPLEQVFRSIDDPLTPDRTWHRGPLTLRVLEPAGDDAARSLSLELQPGTDALFLTWTGHATEPIELPQIGTSIELAPVISVLPLGS